MGIIENAQVRRFYFVTDGFEDVVFVFAAQIEGKARRVAIGRTLFAIRPEFHGIQLDRSIVGLRPSSCPPMCDH